MWKPYRLRFEPTPGDALALNAQEKSPMNSRNFSLIIRAALGFAALSFILVVCGHAQTFTTLARFTVMNGDYAAGSLVQATDGNYYGIVEYGGRNNEGAVYRVTPSGTLTDIYSFCPEHTCINGSNPNSGLILATNGDLYGTTAYGGSSNNGTIFRITIEGKLKTLYSFCPDGGSCSGAYYPTGLIQASDDNFYGTTSALEYGGGGTIFELSAAGDFKTLYSFCSEPNCTDGANPFSGPMQASNGNFYGTTFDGGPYDQGEVYELSPSGRFDILYGFCADANGNNCPYGEEPIGGLSEGSNGSLYGTTAAGGACYLCGTVFEITSAGQLTTLHRLDAGSDPTAAPIQASDGNFYGTTLDGASGTGKIYEVTLAGEFRPLYVFCIEKPCSGEWPVGPLMQATNGTLYGTTQPLPHGESNGTVFSFSMGLGPLVKTVPTAAKPGARVIILGNNLTGSTTVTFNGTPAAFTVVSDTEITATVPAGATTGPVAVTTLTGTLNSNPEFQVLQ
jgi:uncharacterized repeat protein (TIGR03803 family)